MSNTSIDRIWFELGNEPLYEGVHYDREHHEMKVRLLLNKPQDSASWTALLEKEPRKNVLHLACFYGAIRAEAMAVLRTQPLSIAESKTLMSYCIAPEIRLDAAKRWLEFNPPAEEILFEFHNFPSLIPTFSEHLITRNLSDTELAQLLDEDNPCRFRAARMLIDRKAEPSCLSGVLSMPEFADEAWSLFVAGNPSDELLAEVICNYDSVTKRGWEIFKKRHEGAKKPYPYREGLRMICSVISSLQDEPWTFLMSLDLSVNDLMKAFHMKEFLGEEKQLQLEERLLNSELQWHSLLWLLRYSTEQNRDRFWAKVKDHEERRRILTNLIVTEPDAENRATQMLLALNESLDQTELEIMGHASAHAAKVSQLKLTWDETSHEVN